MNELSLFSGAGGGLLASRLLGWRTVGYVEISDYCQRVIAQRIADGYLDRAPIFCDVREFVESGAAEQYAGFVDVVSGGFPCQDISVAGSGKGIDGERSGLWSAMRDVVRAVRPRYVLVENSPALAARGLGRVLGELAEMGFDAQWGVFSACAEGASHTRERMFVVADAGIHGSQARPWIESASPGERPCGDRSTVELPVWRYSAGHSWWDAEPELDRVANGMADRLDRTGAVGNGQVPAVVATAWTLLSANNQIQRAP